jgi:hypothetical protein
MSAKPAVRRAKHGCVLACVLAATGAASADENQFWPEADGFFRLDERTRIFLLASATRAQDADQKGGHARYEDGTLGVHIDYSLRPLLRTALQARDWEQERFLWMRVGYNYVGNYHANGDPYHEDRGVLELSARQPAAWGMTLTGRLRWDARDIDGAYSSRYRVRAGFERPFVVQGRNLVPYAHAEVGYDTRFDTWNRQRYQAGIEVALNDSWRVEPYLARQDDSVGFPRHVNALGLILKYYH